MTAQPAESGRGLGGQARRGELPSGHRQAPLVTQSRVISQSDRPSAPAQRWRPAPLGGLNRRSLGQAHGGNGNHRDCPCGSGSSGDTIPDSWTPGEFRGRHTQLCSGNPRRGPTVPPRNLRMGELCRVPLEPGGASVAHVHGDGAALESGGHGRHGDGTPRGHGSRRDGGGPGGRQRHGEGGQVRGVHPGRRPGRRRWSSRGDDPSWARLGWVMLSIQDGLRGDRGRGGRGGCDGREEPAG